MLALAAVASLYGFNQLAPTLNLEEKFCTSRKAAILPETDSPGLDVYWKTNWNGSMKSNQVRDIQQRNFKLEGS